MIVGNFGRLARAGLMGMVSIFLGAAPIPSRAQELEAGGKESSPLKAKLDKIVLPEFDYDGVSLEEACDLFRLRSKEFDNAESDPALRGINLVVETIPEKDLIRILSEQEKGLGWPSDRCGSQIKLHCDRGSLGTHLREFAKALHLTLRLDSNAVTLVNGEIPRILPTLPDQPTEGARENLKRIQQLRIPTVQFDGTSLAEAVDFLRLRMPESDPPVQGRPYVLVARSGKLSEKERAHSAIIKSLNLRNIPESEMLGYLCELTATRCEVDEAAVVLYPAEMDLKKILQVADDPKARAFAARLRSMILPEVRLDQANVMQAVNLLKSQAHKAESAHDNAEASIDIQIANGIGAEKRIIDGLRLKDVPLLDALRYLAANAGLVVKVEDSVVTLAAPPEQ